MNYTVSGGSNNRKSKKPFIAAIFLAVTVIAVVMGVLLILKPATVEEKVEDYVVFDSSIDVLEQQQIRSAIQSQNLEINSPVTLRAVMVSMPTDMSLVLEEYVPVTSFNSALQQITEADLGDYELLVEDGLSPTAIAALAEIAGVENLLTITDENLKSELAENTVVFVRPESIVTSTKLLNYEGEYYLDSFDSGAIFRELVMEGEGSADLQSLDISDQELSASSVFKLNITGVTALTRVMMNKLDEVGDPTYFSKNIGAFLADADLTYTSNEVSFKQGCAYSRTVFCSPPEFIETLKASGIDLVELTGNHNNDVGADLNAETINLYRSLGWGTVGGGLNNADAAKPFVSDVKGSNVSFLAYNFPDSPNGAAISGVSSAGANSFDFARIETEIAAAKTTSDFVAVNVQFWECYSYPDGYVEFPECDKPIGEQEATFKMLIDLGADMVVGSAAHQPQTYELYKGKPIYYGLGNLYFDQTSWPGTERGLVLTNYFANGELLQTKITPTVYGTELQTRVMTDDESAYLLGRLRDAR